MTDIETVRALTGDTDATNYQNTDSEIQVFLTQGITVLKAAALSLRSIASKKSFSARSVSAGNYREDTGSAIKYLIELAKEYEAMDAAVPADAQVEQIFNDFNYRDILRNRVLRLESIYEA